MPEVLDVAPVYTYIARGMQSFYNIFGEGLADGSIYNIISLSLYAFYNRNDAMAVFGVIYANVAVDLIGYMLPDWRFAPD